MNTRYIVGLLAGSLALAAPAHAQKVYGLVGNDRIVTFNSWDPGTITSDLAITGLETGEVLTGIDIRPLDGLIYSVSTLGNVYRFNADGAGYAATRTGFVQMAPPLSGIPIPIVGNNFGIDFAPFDRIRLVSDLDQNLRINPLNGGAASDPAINNGAGGMPYDLIGFANTSLGADNVGYGIDGVSSSLLRGAGTSGIYVNTNLMGTVFDPLGISLTSQSQAGFDIFYSGGVSNAFLTANGGFYGVDLNTGRASLIGALGASTIRGITTAAVPEPSTWAMMILGFAAVGHSLRRCNQSHRFVQAL
jgi:Domain of unknown function (DUF4394)/PEP-CTERM motif